MATRTGPIVATRAPAHDWSAQGRYPGVDSAARLAECARRRPDHPAVVDARSGDTLTYRQLDQAVHRLAGALHERGVGPGDVISAQLPNWVEAVVVFHASAMLGAVVNPVVPIYREREVGFILRQARPKVLFAPGTFRGFDHLAMAVRLAAEVDRGLLVVAVRPTAAPPAGVVSWAHLLEEGADAEPVGSPSDIALLLYTSGTTSDPKGVLHSHQTLGYEVQSFVDLFSLTEDDAVFMPSPVTHITGLLYGMLLPVVTGCSVTLLDVWDPAVAVTAVQRDCCRFVMGATPFLHGMVVEHERRGEASALRVFVCGGADVPPSLVRRATDVLGCHVARVYGSSEFPTLCCGGPDDTMQVRADTDGMPVGPVTARIARTDPTASGPTVGELLVDGPELFLGYLDAALNQDAFTPDGLFRTGDLASIDAGGAITVHGRLKDIILRGGENISAREVEDLLGEHDEVEQVAVVAMPDPVLVERVCAFVVPADGVHPTVQGLSRFLDARGLARQKHPERVEIVDELPVTASGKVQKYVLRQRLRNLPQTSNPPTTEHK